VAEIEMAKLILSIGGSVLREITLTKERVTIGRRPDNDIVIEDLAISGEHAVIVTQDNDAFLEDLNSTNGTRVNGQPVRKHFLQDNDTIELAKYRILFTADDQQSRKDAGGKIGQGDPLLHDETTVAALRILTGTNAGKETRITKSITTIGCPEREIALILKQQNGFQIVHEKGKECPKVNGHSIGTAKWPISNGDVITFSGIEIVFSSVALNSH
jgi:pSer/pThr/pTyr-binding forkhead associated (FHA) protein